jgi:serine/threonine protein kinase
MERFPIKFGRYELLELLATGGMAQIYRAQLHSAEGTAKELVIKRVLPHLAQNRDFIEMFVDEARISLPLTHGNIVQVFEFGQEGDDYFLAMEYVRGRNLQTIIDRLRERNERTPIPVALYIAAAVAKGLDYAHRFRDSRDRPTGIIHRDVSPQNILVGFQGEIKLTDFGIAKARSRIRETSQGIIRGKAAYLSPEQAACEELDGRSDQFSLGAVLFELMTGRRAFEGINEIETLQRVRTAEIEPPSRLRPEISAELDHVVQRMLAGDRASRFDTCGGLHVVLTRILNEIDPAFSDAALADWMRQVFGHEFDRSTRRLSVGEQLREQLGISRPDDDRKSLSTGEILKLGTLELRTASPRTKRNVLWLMPLGLASIFVFVAIGIALRGSDPASDVKGGSNLDGGKEVISKIEEDGTSEGTSKTASKDGGMLKAPDGSNETTSAPTDQPIAESLNGGARVNPVPQPRLGYLNLNASPWALVDIDGLKLQKETPLFKVPVRPGRHQLRFFNPELKIERVIWVTVRSGQAQTVTVKLTE